MSSVALQEPASVYNRWQICLWAVQTMRVVADTLSPLFRGMMQAIRSFLPLLLSTIAACALTLLAVHYGPASRSAPWEEFYSVFGMMYAITSGFLLVDVLNRHNSLSDIVESELNAVEDVRDFLLYIDDEQAKTKAKIKRELHEYVRSVSTEEWASMSDVHASLNSDTSKELYDVMRAVNQLRVTNDSDRIALGFLIEKLADITTLRTKRISLANQKLPPRLKLLLIFMSVILVLTFVVNGAQAIWLHMFMVASISISVHLLYMIIADLDQPFAGLWQIDKTPLEELQQTFEAGQP